MYLCVLIHLHKTLYICIRNYLPAFAPLFANVCPSVAGGIKFCISITSNFVKLSHFIISTITQIERRIHVCKHELNTVTKVRGIIVEIL